jgi:DNA transposition AAA+ family ATPase
MTRSYQELQELREMADTYGISMSQLGQRGGRKTQMRRRQKKWGDERLRQIIDRGDDWWNK